MNVRNCRKCGAIFNYVMGPIICPACRDAMEAKFKEVETAYKVDRATLLKQLQQSPDAITSISQQALNEKVAKFLVENNTANLVSKK